MPEPKNNQYPPLTPEQQKIAEWRYVWRYMYPGFVLIALILLPFETSLVAFIGMIPYTLATYILSLKPSLVLVFSLQSSRKEELHVPETKEEEEKYRKDGKFLTVFLCILTIGFLVLWLIRRGA